MLIKIINRAGVLLLLLGLGACGGSRVTDRPQEGTTEVDKLVDQKTFRIVSDWAQPLVTNSISQISNSGLLPPGSTAGRINLLGNSNYFRMKGDSVSAYLPYYGERQAGGGYGSNSAIQFKGLPRDLEILKDEKSQGYRMDFDIRDNGENYSVSVLLFPNLKSRITVNSSQRFWISYDGKASDLKEEDAF
jgi:hypothetical protein